MGILKQTLAKPGFSRFFTTQALGALNDNIFRTALTTYIVFQLPGVSQSVKGILTPLALALMMIPFFLFSSIAGEISDRFRKSTLVKIIKTSELMVMIFGAVGFIWGNPYFLLFIVFLMGCQSAFFGPVKYSFLPEILSEDELITGNSLFEGITFIMIVAGCLIGGFVAGIAPVNAMPVGNYIVAGIVVAVAGLGLISAWRIPVSQLGDQSLKPNPKFWKSTVSIIKTARQNESIWLCILGLSWFWLMGGMFLSQLPLFIEQVAGGTPAVYNMLLINFSVGVGLGSMGCQFLLKGRISTFYVPWSALLIALLMVDLAILVNTMVPVEGVTIGLKDFFKSFNNWHLTATLFLISFLSGFFVVPQNTLIQHLAPKEQCSRIIAANNIINSIFMSVSSVAAMAFLGTGGNIRVIFICLAAGSIIVALISFFLLPEHVARLLCAGFMRIVYGVRAKGVENITSIDGPAFLISNHTSFLDAVMLVGFVPRKITFAINTYWAQKFWLRPLFRFIKALPVDPSNPMATRLLIEELEKGGIVVIFPEGRVTVTGRIMKLYEGSAMIVDKAKVPVICAAISGCEYSIFGRFGRTLKKRPQKRICVQFSKPQIIEIPESLKGKVRRRKVNDEMYKLMVSTLFESYNYKSNIWDSFVECAGIQRPARKILFDGKSAFASYQKVYTSVRNLSQIINKNTSPGDKVCVVSEPDFESVVTILALIASGCVPVFVRSDVGTNALIQAVSDSGATKYVTSGFNTDFKLQPVADSEAPQNADDIFTKLGLTKLLCTPGKSKLLNGVKGLFHRFRQSAPSAVAVVFHDGEKTCAYTHTNIMANVYQILSALDLNEKDTIINTMSLASPMGFLWTVLSFTAGIRLAVFSEKSHNFLLSEGVYDQEATVVVSGGKTLTNMAKAANPYDFRTVRYIFTPFEDNSGELQKIYFDKFGCKIYAVYGKTEAPVIALNTRMYNKENSCGRILENTFYVVKDSEGAVWTEPEPCIAMLCNELSPVVAPVDNTQQTLHSCAENTCVFCSAGQPQKVFIAETGSVSGTLIISGPSIATFYMQRSAIMPTTDRGWFNTNDDVVLDTESFLMIKKKN